MIELHRSVARTLGFVLFTALACPSPAMDLLQAFQRAEENNPRLAAAREDRRARLQELPRARSQLYPQISASASARRVNEEVTLDESLPPDSGPFGNIEGEQDYETESLSVDLNQALFRRDAFIAVGQARVVEDQAELEYQLARQELALELAENYFAVLEARDAVDSFEAELRAVARERERAERRQELGVGGITEVNDSRARHAAARASLLQAQSQLRLARQALRRLVNGPVDTVAPLREDFSAASPEPAQAQSWRELAERQSYPVRMAELGLDIAEASEEAARAQRFPQLDLIASWRRDYQGGNPTLGGMGIETEGAVIGLQLSVPLFLGGRISADVQQRSAEREATRYRLLDTRQEAALSAESAFTSVRDSIEQIAAFEEALEAARAAESSTERSVELGQRTTLDLFNVQRERYDVERNLAAARYQYLLAYLQLRSAVGEPIEAVVRDLNRMLGEQ